MIIKKKIYGLGSVLIKKLQSLLSSKDTCEDYKLGKNSFTRNRKLGFCDISTSIIKNNKKTSQKSMDEFLKKDLKQKNLGYTKSAYTQARTKISPSLFIMLNTEIVYEYYQNPMAVKLYKGLRIFAIDGSTLQLPNVEVIDPKDGDKKRKMSQDLRDIHGFNSNQFGKYETRSQISILEDVENNIVHHGILDSYYASEKDMAIEHIDYLAELKAKSTHTAKNDYKDLIIFDRGYPSFALILYLEKNSIDYLIRMPRSRFKEIDEFRDDKRFNDKIIEIELTKDRFYDMKRKNDNPKIAKMFENKKVGDKIKLRAIKVVLDGGEIEILITSLLDKKEYKTKIFKEFYFKRWGIEEEYKVIKSLMQVENFTGITQIAINQDFFATILLLNINNAIINDVEKTKIEDYNKDEKKKRKYKYKINRNYAIGTFKDEFIELIAQNGDFEEFFDYVESKISKNLIPIIPNRTFSRENKCRHKHPMNRKSAI